MIMGRMLECGQVWSIIIIVVELWSRVVVELVVKGKHVGCMLRFYRSDDRSF